MGQFRPVIPDLLPTSVMYQKSNITDASVTQNIHTDTGHRPVVLTEQTLHMMMRPTEKTESRHWQEPYLNLIKLEEETTRNQLHQEIS